MAWASRPIFVSSTFADMQAERDHLRTHVFPALEERLRTRRCHLEWVDLRLGVVAASLADVDTRELQVLKVCLGEVQRCRPFLIVLLGDRYGWVPPAERIAAAAREVGFGDTIAGRSVTEFEIRFGILSDTEQQARSFFYFREPLPYADMPADVAAAYADRYDTHPDTGKRSQRLAGLKGEIEARLPQRVRRYAAGWDRKRQCVTGLDAWGQTVLEDIWSEILATTVPPEAEAEISWQQAERNALEDYIEDRTRDFIGRGKILSQLENLASSATHDQAPWGLSLTAPAGSGKSAIFGEIRRRLKQQGIFVLAHAAAAGARAASVDDMLRRWIWELGAALGTNPGLAENADPDTIDATFHALLNRIANERRVVVLVDALDQFELSTRGRFATWLPRRWPANARLIATAIPCEASRALEARESVGALTLPPLDTGEARAITEAICARYHRALEPEVEAALLAKQGKAGPAWGNTLWLVLAVEELNLVDGDDFRRMRTYTGSVAEQLRSLMLEIVAGLPSDVPGLYGQTFERAEKLFGSLWAQAFLGFIATGRAGWRENDFRVLLPRATGEAWDELRFASLRRFFRGQIRQRGAMGQWDVNHAQMRAAIREHLRGRRIAETRLHGWAAQHLLLSLPADDPLRQTETMVHLLGARDWLLAAQFYGSASLSPPELDGATRVLAETIIESGQAGDMSGLGQVLNILGAAGQISDKRAESIVGNIAVRLLEYVEPILATRGELRSRATLLDAIRKTFGQLATINPRNVAWPTGFCAALSKIGDSLAAQGNLAEALNAYRHSRDIAEQLVKAGLGDAVWENDLATSHDKIGDILVAQRHLAEALTTYKQGRAIRDRLTRLDPSNAAWQRDLALSLGKIGDVLGDQGSLAEALANFRQGQDILERLAKADPGNAGSQRDLSVLLLKIGDTLRDQGNLPEALASYRQDLDIAERLARSDPGNAMWQRDLSLSLLRIANVSRDQGNLTEALATYRHGRDILERIAKADPGNAVGQHDLSSLQEKIGDVLRTQGNLPEALANYRQSREIRERLTTSDPSNAIWQRDLFVSQGKIGDVLMAQGNLAEVSASYQQSRDTAERLAKATPGNPEGQHSLAISLMNNGNLLQAQKKLPEALASYRQSRDIFADLTKTDPSNAVWQHNFSAVLDEIGDVLRAQGKPAEALANYRQSRDIAERLAKADPCNALWQSDLSASLNKIGNALMDQGAPAEALANYRQSRDILERLAKADQGHAESQRLLSNALNKIGDILRDEGQLHEALASYRQSKAIFERLVASDPGNEVWQRALSALLMGIGNVLMDCGALAEALASYRQSRDLFDRLAKADPGNDLWPNALSLVQEKISKVLRALGDLPEALVSLQQGQDLLEHLAEAEPGNTERLRALAVEAMHIGDVLAAQYRLPESLASFQKSRDIFARLVDADPATVEWQLGLSVAHEKMGDVLRAQGQVSEALASYRQSWDIFQPLANTDPYNGAWQRDLVLLRDKIHQLRPPWASD